MSSGGVPSDRAPPPARLFVVCGRGCASSELEALFAAFGVVRDVRYVEDKGVAYVEFSREDPFAAARALERFGANDDASSSLEGGVASCREFLGGCERTIRIMRADDRAAPAGTPSNSVSVTREDETHAKEGSATADTRHRPRRLAEMETGSPDRGLAAAAAAAEDDPPRSRLFVVCPKTASREALRDAFEDLLVRLREEDEGAAGGRGGGDVEREKASDAQSEKSGDGGVGARDKGPGTNGGVDPARDLESVHAVPHKGVAFAKFSSAEVARRCMEAVARAGALGDMRVKCMLAEPKACASIAGAGDGGGGGSGEKENGQYAAASTARPRVAREGSRSPGGSPKRRRAASTDPVGTSVAFERDEGKSTEKQPPKRAGVRPRPPSPASSAESGGARRASTRARASRVGGAFEKRAPFPETSPGAASGLAPGVAAPPPPPHPPPPGHPTRAPGCSFPLPAPPAPPAFARHAPGAPAPPFAAGASPPLPPGPAPWALAPSPAASGSFVSFPGGSGSQSLSLDASASPSLGATSPRSLGSPGASLRSVKKTVAKPRVFVVLDKRATRTQLERAFRETCEGVDSVDLKKDARGASRGFAYVTFAEPAHAFAAAERLDGAEIPPGSGKRAKVMPAEKPPRRRRGARGKSAEASRDFGLDSGLGTRAVSGRLSTDYDVGGFVTEKEREKEPFSQSEKSKRTGDRERDTARGERDSSRDKPSAAALRRPREEEGDEGVSSWQPGKPGKYPRVLAAAAADSEDEDAEVASSLRTASLALTARASRLATEDEAGEAAAALGKVSLGTRGKASLAVPGGPEGLGSKDKSESFGAKAGDARGEVFAAEARAASDETSDEGTNQTRGDGSNRVVFFSLALPLPSYAVRHVLDAKGVVAKLHMSRGGASGWAEYAEAEDAAAAAAALDGTEILGIEFRVAATRPEGDALTGPEGAERLGDDASEGSERHEAGAETNVFETNALETRPGEREGVAAKKRARIAATAGS